MQSSPSHQLTWTLGLTLTVCSLLPFGCGGDEAADETVQAKFSRGCDEAAAAMVGAEGCPENMDLSGITMMCKAFVIVLRDNDDCRQKADAHLSCLQQHEYRCLEGGQVPITTNSDVCAEEGAPFAIDGTNPEESGACVDPATITGP